jgi:hypothetical protein
MHRLLRVGTSVAFVTIAIAWLWTSLAAIANFAFRYPAFDQFRLYRIYLGMEFPANALQLENGHRPVLPALLRLAEVRWLDADQTLQIAVGTIAAVLVLLLVIVTIVRAREIPAPTRAAASALTVLALFWLGNARMLMHGNESVHTYFVMLFCVLALLAVNAARNARAAAWMVAATLCCTIATFSFGTGIASFGCVLALGMILRLRARDLAIPAATAAVVLAIYLAGLPGHGGVRGSLHYDPAVMFTSVARWLSSPWMHAWLGTGDPPLEPWLQSSLLTMRSARPLVACARWLSELFGARALMIESAVVGFAGLCAFAIACVHALRRGRELGALRALALGLAMFAVGAATIVCLARHGLFAQLPEQVFADRYLPWSCLFWLGLALYAIGGERGHTFAAGARVVFATAVCLYVFAPSHRAMAGWSATVSRHVLQSGVAAQLGIWDAERFPDGDDATRTDVLAALDLLKQRHLSMYAEPAFAAFERGTPIAPPTQEAPDGSYAEVVRQFDDTLGQRRIADISGRLTRIEGIGRDPVLLVVDAEGHARGLAKASFFEKGSLRFSVPRKRGFDGYVLSPQPGEALSVLVLDDAGTRAIARIPLTIPTP